MHPFSLLPLLFGLFLPPPYTVPLPSKVGDSRKQRKITHHDIILFCNKKKGKEVEANQSREGIKIEGYRKQEVWSPIPTPILKLQ